MNKKAARKAVIVTGSSGGIGQAICKKFEACGYLVIGVDQAGNQYPRELINLDLGDFDDALLQQQVDTICTKHSASVHTIVNNAACQQLGYFTNLSQTVWRETFEINVIAAVRITQSFIEKLANNKGSVINIGSIHAKATKAGFTAYAASKAALRGFTQALAVELGDKVRVNLIEPAAINTPMLRAGFVSEPQALESLGGFHPSNRIGEPEEVAELAYFLAGKEAGFINGAIISIDGAIGARLYDPS